MNKVYMQTEYGIVCNSSDEKLLVKNINSFLVSQYGYRKMYKAKTQSLLEAYLPFEYGYYYYQFIKVFPRWYFELYPNMDLNGKVKFSEYSQIGWLLYVNRPFFETNTLKQKLELEVFLNNLINNIVFETILLCQYADNEERL